MSPGGTLAEWALRPLNDGNGDGSELNRQGEIRIVVSLLTGRLDALTTALTNHLASYQSRPRHVFWAPPPEHTSDHYHLVAGDEEPGLRILWVYWMAMPLPRYTIGE